jgi:PAS domain S-box-containing protein
MEAAQTSFGQPVAGRSKAGIYISQAAIHLVVGRDGKVRGASPSLLGLLGYTHSELLGRHVLEFVAPHDSGRVLEQLDRGIGGQEIRDLEVEVWAKDGHVRTLLLSQDAESVGVAASSAARVGDGIALSGVDVTERKRLWRTLGDLDRRCEELRRTRSMGRLAGNVARRFSDLLSVIQINAALLRGEPAGPDGQAFALGQILHASQRAEMLVKRLSAVGSLEPGLLRPVDMSRLVGDVARRLEGEVAPAVSIVREPCPGACFVAGDERQLRATLAEVCANAREAIDGSGTITIQTEVSMGGPDGPGLTAAPGVSGNQPCLRIVVSDTGRGMDEATLAQAMEPFFTTDKSGRRCGLGLACVYVCVQAHGGTVRLSSAPGRGTRVEIRLPLVTAPMPATAEA